LCRKYLSRSIIGLPQTLLPMYIYFCECRQWDWETQCEQHNDVHFRSGKEEERKVLFFFHWHSTTTTGIKWWVRETHLGKCQKRIKKGWGVNAKKVFFRVFYFLVKELWWRFVRKLRSKSLMKNSLFLSFKSFKEL
jgi:hypothetical protein